MIENNPVLTITNPDSSSMVKHLRKIADLLESSDYQLHSGGLLMRGTHDDKVIIEGSVTMEKVAK